MGLKVLCRYIVWKLPVVFGYYRKELDAIRPSELATRSDNRYKYYDRNGTLLGRQGSR